jgi:hypothetical protein
MKNARDVNYWQIDHKIKNILETEGVEILPSNLAWKRYKWIKEYFLKKPGEGYFIWIKKQVDFPLFACVSLASKSTKQELDNLIIVEKNLNIKLQGTCNSLKKNLCGNHTARGKIILREGSCLEYEHTHLWGNKNIVNIYYEFILEMNSKLDYNYKIVSAPEKLNAKTKIICLENSVANINIIGSCENTKIKLEDNIILKEKKSSGILKLRLVGKKNSEIISHSTVSAGAECKGHLDCQGLPVDRTSVITLSPEIVCKNNQAQITHEASIGKISEEELFYLQSRGLSEQEAINLIITGFLEFK